MIATTVTQIGDAALWITGAALAGSIIDQTLYLFLTKRARTRGFRTMAKLAEGLRWFGAALGLVVGLALAVPRLGLDASQLKQALGAVTVLAIVVITFFAARIAGCVLRALTQREDVPLPSGSIFVNIVGGAIWVVGGVSVLGALGVSIAPLVTALGVGGLAVGLALQPTLENLFSGIQLIASRQIQPGDFIRLDTGEEGTVLDVTWRNTTVHKASNDVVIVPNSVLARAAVTNFSVADKEYVLVVPVSFASADDPDEVERIALEVARTVVEDLPEAVDGQEPGARFAELTPPSAVLNVSIRCVTYPDRIPVRHELIRRLAKRFAAEQVAAPPMAFPVPRKP